MKKTKAELQQERATLIQQQREILNRAKTRAEDSELTEEEVGEFERIDNEIAALEERITALEKLAGLEEGLAQREQGLNEPASARYRPSAAALGGNPTQPKPKDSAGFSSFGEFVDALRFGDPKGRIHNLKRNENQGGGVALPEAFHEQVMPFRAEFTLGGDGGAQQFVPTQFRPNKVLQLSAPESIVRPRATVLPAGEPPDSKITLPALDQGSNGVYGGVEVTWIEEGGTKPETDADMKEVTLQPHEVAATTVVTDKLLRNWQAADSFIRTLLGNAMIAAEDISFLTGNGSGKPTGVSAATGAIAVNRATANRITFIDVANMLAALLPESVGNATFVAHQTTLPQLMTLKDEAGRYIFIQGDATKGIPSTLLGVPIKFTGRTKPLGTKGDLQLVDFMYYLIKDGSGPFIDASEHVLFRQNKTVIKAFWNVDGKPWVIAPLTLEDKVTKVSPYVTLDVPKA